MQLSVATTAAKPLPVDLMSEALPLTFTPFVFSRRNGAIARAWAKSLTIASIMSANAVCREIYGSLGARQSGHNEAEEFNGCGSPQLWMIRAGLGG